MATMLSPAAHASAIIRTCKPYGWDPMARAETAFWREKRGRGNAHWRAVFFLLAQRHLPAPSIPKLPA